MRSPPVAEREDAGLADAAFASSPAQPQASPPAYEVAIPERQPAADRTTVKLIDRGTTVIYRLGARGRGGRWSFGFTEYVIEADGSAMRTPVSAAEVMAVAREAGREDDVVDMVETALPAASPRNRRRLRAEVAAGRNLERLALPRIQAAILECLADGFSLSDLAERGGFLSLAGGDETRQDTSWLQRRAGLVPHICKTGKRRTARTADYGVFVMLVRAVGADPVDFGV